MKPNFSILIAACGILAAAPFAAAATPPALTPVPTDVVLFDHAQVDQLLAKGGPLLLNKQYKIMSGRRVAPGAAEIHMSDTDIFYIFDGSATFVTGGTPVDKKEMSPGEFHAKSITGGTERHLAKGDVIVIPPGIPHQFTAVDGPFVYFVVKVTQ